QALCQLGAVISFDPVDTGWPGYSRHHLSRRHADAPLLASQCIPVLRSLRIAHLNLYILVPATGIARDHGDGSDRSPGARRIAFWRRQFTPAIDHPIYPTPGVFHFVTADKQVLIPLDDFPQQALIGIG